MGKTIFIFASLLLSSQVLAEEQDIGKNTLEPIARKVSDNRIYLDFEQLEFHENGVIFNSHTHGPMRLTQIANDRYGYYVTSSYLNVVYMCCTCATMYNKIPPECRICGGTDFKVVDLSPDW